MSIAPGPPMVSVVLPVYNGEKFVLEAIRSIQNQTFSNWELIILDDGSLDGSLSLCQEQAVADPRIRVHANGINLGLAKTMNKLVRLAGGQYLAVQEQDDISMPDRLKLEVDLLNANPEVGLVSGVAAWIDDDGEISYYFPGKLHQSELFPISKPEMIVYLFTEQCKVVNAACMFRKTVLNKINGPFDEEAKGSIDWQFFLHVAHRYQIVGIAEVLVKMRRGVLHSHITSINNREIVFYEGRRCINIIYKKYKDDITSPINYQYYRKALSTELTLEGRHWGRFRGLIKLMQAIYYNPHNYKAWISMFEILSRSMKKLIKFPLFNKLSYRESK
jgi:glycosyltransferase involved in cell wall biosynthesis